MFNSEIKLNDYRHFKGLQVHVNIRTSSHNLSYKSIEGGGPSGRWIKKGGCCWTIELAGCLNSSGQLRVSVTGPLNPPSFPLLRLSHYSDRPVSVPVLSEGQGWWGWDCGGVGLKWPLCLS